MILCSSDLYHFIAEIADSVFAVPLSAFSIDKTSFIFSLPLSPSPVPMAAGVASSGTSGVFSNSSTIGGIAVASFVVFGLLALGEWSFFSLHLLTHVKSFVTWLYCSFRRRFTAA